MDKNTLLAIILSVVVISVGFLIQGVLFPTEPIPQTETAAEAPPAEGGQPAAETSSTAEAAGSSSATAETTGTQPAGRNVLQPVELESALVEDTLITETDLFRITFSNKGGTISSLELKDHLDGNEYVDIINSGTTDINGFNIRFGGINAEPVTALFQLRRPNENTVEYYREFYDPNGVPFLLTKTYRFLPGEYLFELEVTVKNSQNEYPGLDWNGAAYTLSYGPQIGPEFESLGGRGEMRYYLTYEDGKAKKNKVRKSEPFVVENQYRWAGIAGKYFTLLVIPDNSFYTLTFSNMDVDGVPEASQFYLTRPIIKSATNTDLYRFYAGPKTNRDLARYEKAERNAYGLQDLDLVKAVDSSLLLGWLESILKFMLVAIYRVVPNYGVAIILLTIIVKIVLYPITRKSYESQSKMQAINPKVTEIRERLKDNPTKMNQEMAELYKREGVNPLGGCLPLLLQMPVFFAMYGLFNKHFDLRGAPFMLWINDLSAPDSIWNFAPVTIPILGWSDLRILPLLFIGTQLLSSKLMQTPDSGASNKNMKLMQTFMPIFFFFILYDAPSGMLLYWIMTNVLTAGQQIVISKIRQNKPVEPPASGNVIKGNFAKPPSAGRKLPPPKKKPNNNKPRRKSK